jgi:hypothetical protein
MHTNLFHVPVTVCHANELGAQMCEDVCRNMPLDKYDIQFHTDVYNIYDGRSAIWSSLEMCTILGTLAKSYF